MIGWRKLGAWALVYLFTVYMSAIVKIEIPDNNKELIEWVTGFFFGSNAFIHGLRAIGGSVTLKKKDE